jgi:hypothetical protein
MLKKKARMAAATKVKPVRNNFAKNITVISSLLTRRQRSGARTKGQITKHQELLYPARLHLKLLDGLKA